MYSNKKFIIDTNQAPRAIGPYSQAVSFGGLLFCSGQIPVDPHSGEVNMGGIEAQTRQVMNNLQAVLMAAGLDFSHVLKTTVYLRNMNDYKLMNDVYALYFDYSPPARAAVEVSRLPKDVLVEIECIAAAPTSYEDRVTSTAESANPEGPADQWESEHIAEANAAHSEFGIDYTKTADEAGEEEAGLSTGSEELDALDALDELQDGDEPEAPPIPTIAASAGAAAGAKKPPNLKVPALPLSKLSSAAEEE